MRSPPKWHKYATISLNPPDALTPFAGHAHPPDTLTFPLDALFRPPDTLTSPIEPTKLSAGRAPSFAGHAHFSPDTLSWG